MAVIGGQDHDREHQHRRQHAGAAEVGGEQGNPPELQVQPIAQRTDQRDHDEETPQTVDHTRNRREELDQVLQQALELVRQPPPHRMQLQSQVAQQRECRLAQIPFAQENRGGDPERTPEDQGQHGGVERSPDLGKDPVALRIWIPYPATEKSQTVQSHGGNRRHGDAQDDERHQQDHEAGEPQTGRAEHTIDQHLTRRRRLCDLSRPGFEHGAWRQDETRGGRMRRHATSD